jgi:LysR family transcriptional regulator, hydrogen peroxide-inducible genes activator
MKSININIQQLEYIVAVDTYRHFKTAADNCYVTQPTLSMMIQKLEEELGVQIFDRSKHPVVPTTTGTSIIQQARVILDSIRQLPEIVQEEQTTMKGELRVGIIPTIAPYLLPLFIGNFIRNFPSVKLKISELTTNQIIAGLENQQLDAAIMATPLHNNQLKEDILYYEQFVVYASPKENLLDDNLLKTNELNSKRIWFLEEGHCMRDQIINLCNIKQQNEFSDNLEYESGSIETLKRMVKINGGLTILPELAVKELNKEEYKLIRYFEQPAPVREISIVTYRHFVKKRMLDALKSEIQNVIPDDMKNNENKSVTEIFG